jgi:tRNA nucleotidyltransferase (CCA-adding enzyme)
VNVYLVGGAVRDKLLGLVPEERDWVVVGATPEEMIAQGFRPVGRDFPVFLHPETGEEYALARTERKQGHGYRGFQVHASPEVTLEQDLQRRDLTINAMAETPEGELIDPFGGREDLDGGLLRHVSPAFVEDPVRILRTARLAARFAKWGFRVAHGTHALMRRMVAEGEVDYLVPERVWAELAKALQSERPARFFHVLHSCGALSRLFPEILPHMIETAEAHGAGDQPAALASLDRSAALSDRPEVRLASLLLHLARTSGIRAGCEAIDTLCRRLKAPNEYRKLALLAARLFPALKEDQSLSPVRMLDLLEQADAFRRPERLERALLACQAAGNGETAEQAQRLRRALAAAAPITAQGFVAQGLQGPAVGEALRSARIQAIEALPAQSPNA